MSRALRAGIASGLLFAAACGEGGGEDTASSSRVVEVWFSRGEEPVRAERRVEPGSVAVAGAEAAEARAVAATLTALTAGPTAAERESGLGSWFSEETAGALSSVERREGFLRVDFQGLDRAIPGASSSAGSAQLLTALDSTVFQFSWVDSVEYRLNGSCEAFWAWLQRACRVVRRE